MGLSSYYLSLRPVRVKPPPNSDAHSLPKMGREAAEALGKRVESNGVQETSARLVASGGNEMTVLLDLPDDRLFEIASPEIAGGVLRLREGNVLKVPGDDGVYGKISVLNSLLPDLQK